MEDSDVSAAAPVAKAGESRAMPGDTAWYGCLPRLAPYAFSYAMENVVGSVVGGDDYSENLGNEIELTLLLPLVHAYVVV